MEKIVSAKYAPYWLIGLLIVLYAVVPAYLHEFVLRHPNFLQLAGITLASCIAIWLGYRAPLLDRQFGPNAWRIEIKRGHFQAIVWGAFVAVLVLTIATAPSVPLISALQGKSQAVLDVERAQFLKLRVGWAAALPYVHTLLTGALVPMALAQLFLNKSRWRYAALALMALYSLLFLVKSQIIFTVAPLIYVAFVRHSLRLAGITILLGVGVILAGGLLTNVDRAVAMNWAPRIHVAEAPPAPLVSPPFGSQETSYFGSRYNAANAADYLIWRSFAVPIFTAADALYVHNDVYGGKLMLGATSSLLARVTGQGRVDFESDVYNFQWGRSEFGRSNTSFMIEAFINFGWAGVVLMGLFVGQSLRWLWLTPIESAKAVWPLYAFLLYSGGLIPILLSNGYAVFFAIVLFVRFPSEPPV